MLKRMANRFSIRRLVTSMKKEPEYIERYTFASGKGTSMGGYSRLVRGYEMRRVRDVPRHTQMDSVVFYNHLPWFNRFFLFFQTKRKRLILCVLFALTFNYTGNIGSMLATMVERTYKTAWNDFKMAKAPDVLTYQSAVDTVY